MRRLLPLALAFVICLLAPSLAAAMSAATADPAPAANAAASGSPASQAIERYVAWLGGWQALNDLEDVTLTGTLAASGLSGSITTTLRRDGSSHTEFDLKVVRGQETVTPDEAWSIEPTGALSPMGEAKATDARRVLARAFARHLSGDGVKISYEGKLDHGGRSWEVVRFTYPNGDLYDLLLDPGDGSQEWERTVVDTQETWTHLTDWRRIGSLHFPFRQESVPQLAGAGQVVEWREITVDTGIPDAVFARPGAVRNPIRIASGAAATDWAPVDLYERAYLYLRGTVNGVETDLVLDSGAGMTVLDQAFAAKLGLKSSGTVPALGAGGTSTASMVTGVSIRAAGLAADSLTAVVIDLSGVEKMLGRPMPVIFGNEVFKGLIVDLDYAQSRIRFCDPASYRYEGPGHRVDLFPIEGGHRAVEAQIENLPPARFQVDTGSGGTVDIFRYYNEEHRLLEGRKPVSESLGGGVGGAVPSPVSTLKSFTIGGYALKDVPAVFSTVDRGAFDTKRMAGNLGAGILSRFRVIFDFGHNALWFEPSPGWDAKPFRKNRTGLAMRTGDQGLEVLFVAPGSPAENAGWKKGDIIVAVDGRKIDPANYWRVKTDWSTGPAGSVVKLTLANGEERTIRLQDYY